MRAIRPLTNKNSVKLTCSLQITVCRLTARILQRAGVL